MLLLTMLLLTMLLTVLVLLQAWDASKLCFESDTEPYAKTRDAAVQTLAAEAGVEVFTPVSHTIYVRHASSGGACWSTPRPHPHTQDPAAVVRVTKTAPLTYKAFEKAIEKLGPAPLPVSDAPAALPGPKKGALLTEGAIVPSLKEIGYPETNTSPFKACVCVFAVLGCEGHACCCVLGRFFVLQRHV